MVKIQWQKWNFDLDNVCRQSWGQSLIVVASFWTWTTTRSKVKQYCAIMDFGLFLNSVLVDHADIDMSKNLFWWVILISWWVVLNSDLALLPWIIIDFDEHIWIRILTHGLVTFAELQSFNCCDDFYMLMTGNYGDGNYACSIFRTAHQDINVTHQNKLFNMSTSAWPIITILPTNWRKEH